MSRPVLRSALVVAALGLALGLALAQETALERPHPLPPAVRFGRFATAALCARCHSNAPAAGALRDAAGRGVAPFDLWRGTMMANAARDPFFRAALAAEVAAIPAARERIEAKCLRCHAPMAADEVRRRTGEDAIGADVFALGSRLTALARDGVSCTVCHQIAPDGLGEPASWNGGFTINDDREIYGPHADPHGSAMRTVTGYWPTEGQHVTSPELCATCHTLFVETLDEDGHATGHRLAEQTPFLEWRNSAFRDGPGRRTCQDCHVPTTSEEGAPIRARLAREPEGADFTEIPLREPVGRHVFVGGNTLVPAILRDHREELGVEAPAAAFDATIERARAQLRERTARLEITGVVKGADFSVRITNLAGHKLPTAHPSRRMWLRVRVRDLGTGRVVWASGEHDARGRILGADGRPLPSEAAGGPVAPHRAIVRRPDEVALYETVLARPDGTPTFRAMLAAGYAKDNRLLPRGWRADHADADATRPRGVEDDADFEAGGDTVVYELVVPDATRAYAIEATLLYQPVSARFLAELFTVDAPEVERFRAMVEQADPTPEVVATARVAVLP